MKVDMNEAPEKETTVKPEKKQAPKKEKSKKKSPAPAPAPAAEGSGNVYKESLKMYTEKWKAQLAGGGIFRQNKFWIVIAVILAVILVSVNSNTNNAKMQFSIQLKNLTAKTDNLNKAIDEVKADLEEQARINSVKLTEEEEELAKNSAVEQGVYVATLQNAYRYLDSKSDSQAFNNNKASLVSCFGDSEKASTIWYSYNSDIPGTWEFASKASFAGDSAKVLWLCYADADHSLLAYCTAKYNAGTKLFTDVEWKITRYVESNISSDADPVTDTEHIISVQDALKDIADKLETNSPGIDEEFDPETIENNNDVSEGRESYKDAVANGEIEGEEFDDRYHVGLGSSSDEGDSSDEEDNSEEDNSEESEEDGHENITE